MGQFGGGWGGFSAVNDSTPLIRLSGSLSFTEGRGANNAIRDDDLKQILDSVQFERYEAANRLFIKGDNRQSLGVILGVPAAILTLIAVTHQVEDDPDLSRKLYIISGALVVPSLTIYGIGLAKKRKAVKALNNICDTYNQELEYKKAAKMLQFEFAPTVMLDTQYSTSFGATLNMRF